jgi:hypothetical protein
MADVTGIIAAAAVAVGGSSKDKDNASVLATARSRLDMAVGALSESREDEIDDLKFYAGSPDNHWQWPSEVYNARVSDTSKRPTLTVNIVQGNVFQITNDFRQNMPSVAIKPTGDESTFESAQIYESLMRNVEYTSNARLPVAGQFSVAMLLDAPRMVHCFDLEIESDDQADATATPVRFDFSGTARTASPRSNHRIRFRLLSQKGPVSGAQPLLRYFRAPGADRGTAAVSETAPGEYEAQITLGEAGAWMVHVQFAATPDSPPQQSYIGIIVR